MKPCNVCNVNPKAPGRGRRTCNDCEGLCSKCKGPLDSSKRCASCVKVRNRELYRNDPEWRERKKIANKLSLYGLTLEEYESLPKTCYSCGSSDKLVIDHCHSTDKVRGTLCSNCNTALGLLQEDVSVMLKLIEYIEASK